MIAAHGWRRGGGQIRGSAARSMKRLGAGTFLFFLIKGLAWLLVPVLPMLLALLR